MRTPAIPAVMAFWIKLRKAWIRAVTGAGCMSCADATDRFYLCLKSRIQRGNLLIPRGEYVLLKHGLRWRQAYELCSRAVCSRELEEDPWGRLIQWVAKSVWQFNTCSFFGTGMPRRHICTVTWSHMIEILEHSQYRCVMYLSSVTLECS